MARAPKELTITEADIVRERDERGLSWKQVAINLGLGNPGAARRAYAELTGRPHDSSQPLLARAPKGSGARKTLTPLWDDDSDQDEIEAKLNGPWVEESGEGKNYKPGHWTGSFIKVRRSLARAGDAADLEWTDELHVSRTAAFTYGPEGDQPLQVTVFAANGASHTYRVSDILAVS